MKRLFCTLAILLLTAVSLAQAFELAFDEGETIPEVAVGGLVTPDGYPDLGLGKAEGPFTIGEVGGELLVLELFNRFCLTCWEQAPLLNQFWEQLREEGLRDRVKVLALAQGNAEKGVLSFKHEHKLTYPLAADPEFSAIDTFGDPGGTPLSVFLRRDGSAWRMERFHLGKMTGEQYMEAVQALLSGREVVLAGAEGGSPASMREARQPLSGHEQEDGARALLTQVRGKKTDVKRLHLRDGSTVFQAVDPAAGPLELYARVAERHPVCDLCHTNVFIFAFDHSGTVLGFEPLYATKVGNEEWSEADRSHFVARIVGREMGAMEFDVDVDAVTGASMSSALMYDEVRRTAKILGEL